MWLISIKLNASFSQGILFFFVDVTDLETEHLNCSQNIDFLYDSMIFSVVLQISINKDDLGRSVDKKD